ncbi:MAG: hypothetical protein JSU91_09065 [Thermoplasmatales archaeon]|nr:MAG: hypothetical protein JSU91_09065 [Thermoplasmatales archaeon]
MAGKITGFFREFVLIFSAILIILGFFILIIGITGVLEDHPMNFLNLTNEILKWGFYFLIIGLIVLGTGLWYLYSYFKNRKFLLDELKTNKRSELIKKHAELKNIVKHLPKKYQKLLKDKEEELSIR